MRVRTHPRQINARTYSPKHTSGKNKQDRTGDKGGGICFVGMRGARQEKVNADVWVHMTALTTQWAQKRIVQGLSSSYSLAPLLPFRSNFKFIARLWRGRNDLERTSQSSIPLKRYLISDTGFRVCQIIGYHNQNEACQGRIQATKQNAHLGRIPRGK